MAETTEGGRRRRPAWLAGPLLPFLLLGLAQGALLWWLKDSFSPVHGRWPGEGHRLQVALIWLSLAFPLAWYLGDDAPQAARRRWLVAAGLGLLFALLGLHAGRGWGVRDPGASLFMAVPPSVVLGFVLLALSSGRDPLTRRWSYTRLFAFAWRNALALPAAALLTVVLWLLLWAGAWLMESIGLPALRRLLGEAAFAIPVTTAMFGVAVGAVLGRAETLPTLRRFWLAMNTWFLPLALAFAVVWSVALLFTGLAPLWATRSAATYLFWFCTLAVVFANAAYQDGREPPALPPLVAGFCRWAWLAIPVLALLGDWALWLRVRQYGWTTDRVWAALVGLLVSLYALGYAASLLRRRAWMHTVPGTNVLVAAVKVIAIVLLISPLADVQRITVASQVGRLMRGEVSADTFDWSYLNSAPYGTLALERLQHLPPEDARTVAIGQRALAEARLQAKSHSGTETARAQDQASLADVLQKQLPVLPAGAHADRALLEWLAKPDHGDWDTRDCLRTPDRCLLWLVDLNGDGQREAVVLVARPRITQAVFFAAGTAGWRQQGRPVPNSLDLEAWRNAITAGRAEPAPPLWPDLIVDGQRLEWTR